MAGEREQGHGVAVDCAVSRARHHGLAAHYAGGGAVSCFFRKNRLPARIKVISSHPLMKTSFIFSSVALLLSFNAANAAILGNEPFSGYTTGSSAGQTVLGSGFTGVWSSASGSSSFNPSSLSYSQGAIVFPTSGGRVTTAVTGFNSTFGSFDISLGGAYGAAGLVDASLVGGGNVAGVFYMSFLARNASSDVPNGNEDFGGLHFHRGATDGLGIGNNWSAWAYSTFGPGYDGDLLRPSDSTFQLVNNDVHLFVVRLNFVAGGNDNATVWMDPDLTLSEAAQPNTVYRTSVSGDLSFDQIGIRAGSNNNDNSWEFDEIRTATTWSEVTPVPEPGTAALCMAGVSALMLRRRRAQGV